MLKVEPGLNRTHWDLEYQPARWVTGARNDSIGKGTGPRALSGEYTLRLVVDGVPYTRSLRVEADPASSASSADLAAQFALELELRDRMSQVADLAMAIRSIVPFRAILPRSRASEDRGQLT